MNTVDLFFIKAAGYDLQLVLNTLNILSTGLVVQTLAERRPGKRTKLVCRGVSDACGAVGSEV